MNVVFWQTADGDVVAEDGKMAFKIAKPFRDSILKVGENRKKVALSFSKAPGKINAQHIDFVGATLIETIEVRA